MPVVNETFDYHRWATDKVYDMMRSARIGKKKARGLAKAVVGIAGPGKGHRNVKYRIAPEAGGWWMVEHQGGDAHEAGRAVSAWVPEKAVKRLWRAIKKGFPVSAKYRDAGLLATEVAEQYKFRLPEVVKVMAARKMLPKRFHVKTFYGGVNRKAYYFPLYLYPMRVLDFLGRIRFGISSWRLE